MPELPEVETIVRGLQKKITGKTITKTTVLHPNPLGTATPVVFNKFIKNQVVACVERFGKYIHIRFQSGRSLVCHLRMTGKYIYCPQPLTCKEDCRHIRVIFHFSDQSCLLYKDLRIFGTIRMYEPAAVIKEKVNQGLEPLSPLLTPGYLLTKAKKRQVAVKIFLLDQKVITGLGNIYVCEILYQARINPFLQVSALTAEQAALLITTTRSVIKQAIKCNGTSISDFRNVDDKQGKFQEMLQVYRKTGTLCPRCRKGSIMREKQGQRSTFYCPVCQESGLHRGR